MNPKIDNFGEDGLNGQNGGPSGGHGFTTTNIDPHEIFNMFMNGGGSPFSQFQSMNGGMPRHSPFGNINMETDNDFGGGAFGGGFPGFSSSFQYVFLFFFFQKY